jgi:hypothetical protein
LLEPLYRIQVECIQCGQPFHTSKVRPSFKKPVRTDSDFCCHYNGVNPDYYIVRVCPSCGFAASENFSPLLTDRQRSEFDRRIGRNWPGLDYGGERNWDEAVNAFKLALTCAQIKQEKDRIIAGLLHHLAWLYRYKNLHDEGRRFLQHALDAYIRVYEFEKEEIRNARLMYLIGELHRRLGQYDEAVKWFSRDVDDKRIMDAAMIRASREQWAAVRAEMSGNPLTLPDEMDQMKR